MFTFKKKSLITAVVSLALLFALSSLIPPLRLFLMPVFRFPLQAVSAIRQEIGGLIFFHRNMVSVQRLQMKADFLDKKLIDRTELMQENARLRRLLDFKTTAPYRVIAARVIGRDPSNWVSVVIIDKGSASGIRKGLVCVTFLGLVGRVEEVSVSSSKVMLLSDPNMGVSAVSQRTRQEGLVSGSLGGVLIMKYLPKDSDIKTQDVIITSEFTGVYPKGLLIGTVSRVGEEFSGLTRYAVIKPAVDFSALEELLIVMP